MSNEERIEFTQVEREMIKLERNIPNATDVEFNREARFFIIDVFIKILENSKRYWQTVPAGEFDILNIVDTNFLIETVRSSFGDEFFNEMNRLIDEHSTALLEKFSEEEVENWFEDFEDED